MPKTTRVKLSKTKVVGIRRLVDTDNGEVFTANTVVQEITDANFKKIWLAHILDAIDELGNAKMKFIFWLINNSDRENRIIGSYKNLADASGVSLPTVARLMGKLKNCDVVRREVQSVHRINPEIVFQGPHQQRMNILIRYRGIDDMQGELPIYAAGSSGPNDERSFAD